MNPVEILKLSYIHLQDLFVQPGLQMIAICRSGHYSLASIAENSHVCALNGKNSSYKHYEKVAPHLMNRCIRGPYVQGGAPHCLQARQINFTITAGHYLWNVQENILPYDIDSGVYFHKIQLIKKYSQVTVIIKTAIVID